ncbi:Yip1 family protein [Ktedonospora formicarum]|uniref:Yip1 domain-containing protein n=1 Tax=Ktedonospora formicarum TaxID=2778364 RepID=A0A8J3I0Z8_9CHLR|nr:Yip1 family protein [Ktedonospora formicarum]GHO43549.1 hypothetical protein KSX_17120 [Ktedonospora formicarum]
MEQDPRNSALGDQDQPAFGKSPYDPLPPDSQPRDQYSPHDGTSIPASIPLKEDIQQLPGKYLRILTRPGTQRFAMEAGQGQWDIVWLQLVAYAILVGILSYVGLLLSGGLNTLTTASAGTIAVPATAQRVLEIAASLAIIILIPLAFFFWQGILFMSSRMFGGRGLFVQQNYAATLYWIPLGIIGSILGALPFIDGTITLIITVLFGCYQLVLTFFALKAVHQLSTGRALGALILPTIVIFVFALCAFASLYALSGLA